jgi:hypothetical protein
LQRPYVGADIQAPEPWTKLQVTTPLPDEVSSRPVGPRLAEVTDWLESNLHDCLFNHPDCMKWADIQTVKPARLLDLETGLANPSIRLIKTGISFDERYMTLSHRWGKVPLYKTTKANMPERYHEIKEEELPTTFQQAITITRKLGVRFLWIDCLCIVQDDPLDWEIEASKMASIYSGSYLTLAATVSFNSRRGLIPEHPSSTYFKIDAPGPENKSVYVRQDQYDVDLDKGHSDIIGQTVPWGVPLVIIMIALYSWLVC